MFLVQHTSGTDHVGFQHLRDTKEPCRSTRRRVAPAHARAIDGRFVAKFGFGARSWPDEKKAGNGTTTSARRAAHRLLLFAQFHFSFSAKATRTRSNIRAWRNSPRLYARFE